MGSPKIEVFEPCPVPCRDLPHRSPGGNPPRVSKKAPPASRHTGSPLPKVNSSAEEGMGSAHTGDPSRSPLAAVVPQEDLSWTAVVLVEEAVTLADVHTASLLQEETGRAATTCNDAQRWRDITYLRRRGAKIPPSRQRLKAHPLRSCSGRSSGHSAGGTSAGKGPPGRGHSARLVRRPCLGHSLWRKTRAVKEQN